MTANLNFEAEPFGPVFRSEAETQEYEAVRDHRTGVVHDHRTGASFPTVRDHRTPGTVAQVRDHRAGGWSGWGRGYHGAGPARVVGRTYTAFPRRVTGFGVPGYVHGVSRSYPGGSVWNRNWYGGRPYYGRGMYGWHGYPGYGRYSPYGHHYWGDYRRRWPWLGRDRADGMGAGAGGYDGGYQGTGYSGTSDSGPSSSGTDYAGSDTLTFTPSAPMPTPTPGTSASEDPQIVAWAQGCLSQIVGGWVPQDGNLGRLTRRAIQMFQNQSQLPTTGTLDDNTLAALQHACHDIAAGGAPAPGAPPQGAPSPLPNVVVPDANAGVPPPPTNAGAPAPPAPPPAVPDAGGTTPGQTPELFEWSPEFEQYENHPIGACEPDRCTSPYIQWVQNSLNQVFGQRLAITGTMNDATIAAINRFRLAKRLGGSESYHVGPLIENALLAAGATPPPTVPPTQCGVSDPSKLIPVLDRSRGDIPLEFLLAWIDVESGWVLEAPSVTCERGFFQLYPEDSAVMGLDHDRIGTDAAYSIQSGVPLVTRARKRIERAVRSFGVPMNSDLYWRLVKLWHWIPSGPEKILASMSAQGVRATDWDTVRAFARNNAESLTKLIRRDPRDGVRGVDRMFERVNVWRKRLQH